MDPPSDDVPQPKLQLSEPKSPSEAVPKLNDDPPQPPPSSATTGSNSAIATSSTTDATTETVTADTDAQLATDVDKMTLTESDATASLSPSTPFKSHDDHDNNKDNETVNHTPKTPSSQNKPTPEAVPSQTAILSPLTPKERTTSFEELRSYEAKRRSIYLKKLKSSSLYWRSFRNTLSKSYEETERAEILMTGSVLANQNYANYLAAAAQDRLDYNGKPMNTNDHKTKKFVDNKKMKYTTLGAGSMLWNISQKDSFDSKTGNMNVTGANVTNGMTSTGAISAASATSPINKSLTKSDTIVNKSSFELSSAPSMEGLPSDSILNSVITCHQQMADKFYENYTFVKDVTLVKMKELRTELENEVHYMSQLGDIIIFELEKAEDDVHKAWAAYYTLASMNVGSGIQSPPSTVSPRKLKSKDNQSASDVWLVEMHYRMSVAYLTTIWERCSSELSNLFTSMKELECNRRFRLNELLIIYMQRSERLWLSLPNMITTVTKELVSSPVDKETIENEVQQIIRDTAQVYQQKEASEMTKDQVLNAPGLAGVKELQNGYELQSPLMSDLLGKAQVIWRKNETLMSVWKPSLAIATSDSYLHLFDIPHSSNVQTGTAPEVAFQALVPPVKVPNETDLRSGNYIPGTNTSWYDNLVPTDSIDLTCSKITFSEMKGNSTFELTETLPPNKISTVSNFTRKKKLALRMYSSQHMVEWLLTLRNYGAE